MRAVHEPTMQGQPRSGEGLACTCMLCCSVQHGLEVGILELLYLSGCAYAYMRAANSGTTISSSRCHSKSSDWSSASNSLFLHMETHYKAW